MAITKKVRKFDVGGLSHLTDPRIPRAEVEVYVRSSEGETFHVGSLHEGLYHLLSNEGYRVGIYEHPDGAGFGKESFGIVIRRNGNDLQVELRAPMIDFVATNQELLKGNSKVCWDFRSKPPQEQRGAVEVISLNEVLGVDPLPEPPPVTEFEVTIDGN